MTLFIKVIDFPIANILYAYFVSIVILIIFLLYEYSKVRVFYKQIYRALNSEDIIEDIVNIGEVRTKEQKLFTELLKNYINHMKERFINMKTFKNITQVL